MKGGGLNKPRGQRSGATHRAQPRSVQVPTVLESAAAWGWRLIVVAAALGLSVFAMRRNAAHDR
jgi:hypothetical protein